MTAQLPRWEIVQNDDLISTVNQEIMIKKKRKKRKERKERKEKEGLCARKMVLEDVWQQRVVRKRTWLKSRKQKQKQKKRTSFIPIFLGNQIIIFIGDFNI